MDIHDDADYSFLDQIDIDDVDYDTLAAEFLSQKNIYELHLYLYKSTILQHLVEGDTEISNTIAHQYVEDIRKEIVDNTALIIEYHIDEENYELVIELKKHTEMLIEQTLQLKTKLEKFL